MDGKLTRPLSNIHFTKQVKNADDCALKKLQLEIKILKIENRKLRNENEAKTKELTDLKVDFNDKSKDMELSLNFLKQINEKLTTENNVITNSNTGLSEKLKNNECAVNILKEQNEKLNAENIAIKTGREQSL